MDPVNQSPAVETSKSPAGNKKIILIIIGVIVLAGMGAAGWHFYGKKSGTVITEDGKKVKYTTDSNTTTLESEEGSLSMGENVKLPSDFPKNLPVYPDVKLTSAWSGSTKKSDPNDDKSDINAGYTGTVKKSCSEVTKWFKGEYTKLGWKIDLENNYGLTVSTSKEVSSSVVTQNNDVCEISVSTMDKTELPVTTSSGEKDYDQIVEETRQLQEDVESIDQEALQQELDQ